MKNRKNMQIGFLATALLLGVLSADWKRSGFAFAMNLSPEDKRSDSRGLLDNGWANAEQPHWPSLA